MKILLPPSEGKTEPSEGGPVCLESLVAPELTRVREQLLTATVRLSGSKRAMEVLGLGPTQADLVARNAELLTGPTDRADRVYTGVLYEHLQPSSLPSERLDDHVLIASALFGLVRPSDRIPAYRLSASTALPRLGTVASRWKPVIPRAISTLARDNLVVDLRSGAYVGLGPLPSAVDAVTVRVLQSAQGQRKVVSHFNKATKGEIVHALIAADLSPRSADELVEALQGLGWTVEKDGHRLDVILGED